MMKLIALLLLVSVSWAKPVAQHIDDAYSYSYEEKLPEYNRGIANEEQVESSEKDVEVVDESDRNLASEIEENSKDKIQKHNQGIKYWKY